MKTNLKTFPSDIGVECGWRTLGDKTTQYILAVRDWKNAFEKELREKLKLNEDGFQEIKDKKDLIHNSMKLVASSRIGLLDEILGEDSFQLHQNDKT